MRRVLGPKSTVKELEILKQVSDDARQHNIEKEKHYSTSATISTFILHIFSFLASFDSRKRLPVMEMETDK